MWELLKKRWFLLALLLVIPAAFLIGQKYPLEEIKAHSDSVSPQLITAIVLFLMAFSLDSDKLRGSLRAPGPVAWTTFISFGFLPFIAWIIMRFQTIPDFQYGLMIVASAPCTMAAASVWTRRAKGNDAVSLLVTVITNALCFLVTPLLLEITLNSRIENSNIELNFLKMFRELVGAVLIPTFLGQLARQIPFTHRIATQQKIVFGVVAQFFILVIVFVAACHAGSQLLASNSGPSTTDVLVLAASCVAVHLAALTVSYWGAKRIGFQREDCIAAAFAGSQKTLPISIFIATSPQMFGNPNLGVPFIALPILIYHASQLFVDTAIADHFADHPPENNSPENETTNSNSTSDAIALK